jgi:hypothetical protein
VQAAAQALIAAGLRNLTELLPGGEEVAAAAEFSRSDFAFELAHGSRIRFLPREHAFAFFPCLLSDLLRQAPGSDEGIEKMTRDLACGHIVALEEGYRRIFLPTIHTFSWDTAWRPQANVEFTPFPRPALLVSQDVAPLPAGPGIYLMASGVGSAGDASILSLAARLLKDAREPLAVYAPPGGFPAAMLASFSRVVELNAAHISHHDIRLVVGRAGWGTLWECMNAGKVFAAIPPLPGDDPEIALNLRTLAATGLAVIGDETSPSAWDRAAEVTARSKNTLDAFQRDYGTTDGLEVMARRILELAPWR